MEIEVSTPVLRKHIGCKIKYRRKHSSEFIQATIVEIYNRQLNIGSDWISFDQIASIVLI